MELALWPVAADVDFVYNETSVFPRCILSHLKPLNVLENFYHFIIRGFVTLNLQANASRFLYLLHQWISIDVACDVDVVIFEVRIFPTKHLFLT